MLEDSFSFEMRRTFQSNFLQILKLVNHQDRGDEYGTEELPEFRGEYNPGHFYGLDSVVLKGDELKLVEGKGWMVK
jgi:hypothetical protein